MVNVFIENISTPLFQSPNSLPRPQPPTHTYPKKKKKVILLQIKEIHFKSRLYLKSFLFYVEIIKLKKENRFWDKKKNQLLNSH